MKILFRVVISVWGRVYGFEGLGLHAPEHLSDGERDGLARIPCFGRGDSDGFDPCVERAAEDKYRGHAAEAIAIPGTGVVPVAESYGVAVDTTRNIDDAEDEVCTEAAQLDESKPELSFTERLVESVSPLSRFLPPLSGLPLLLTSGSRGMRTRISRSIPREGPCRSSTRAQMR
jgi:hypothetical protein